MVPRRLQVHRKGLGISSDARREDRQGGANEQPAFARGHSEPRATHEDWGPVPGPAGTYACRRQGQELGPEGSRIVKKSWPAPSGVIGWCGNHDHPERTGICRSTMICGVGEAILRKTDTALGKVINWAGWVRRRCGAWCRSRPICRRRSSEPGPGSTGSRNSIPSSHRTWPQTDPDCSRRGSRSKWKS